LKILFNQWLLVERKLDSWQNPKQIQERFLVASDDVLSQGKFQRIVSVKWEIPDEGNNWC
jgi:hypothetical protein